MKKPGTAIVALGRTGDIINALPIARHLHLTNQNPHWLVAREFADVLDGVSYVDPVALDFGYEELHRALGKAHNEYEMVVRCQVHGGPEFKQDILCSCYSIEAWREAGFLSEYFNPDWRVVFDRRDEQRERVVWADLCRSTRPAIAVNLSRAVSTQYPHAAQTMAALVEAFPQYEIVDLAQANCERIYDMLGVMEVARLIVSIDTATYHLSLATNTPTILLKNDDPWVHTRPRYNSAGEMHYHEATPEAVVRMVAEALW